MEHILEVQDLHTSFLTSSGEVKAVRGVSFTVEKGESVGIVGEMIASIYGTSRKSTIKTTACSITYCEENVSLCSAVISIFHCIRAIYKSYIVVIQMIQI